MASCEKIINFLDETKFLLHMVMKNDTEAVKEMINLKVCVDVADDHGMTALMRACMNGNAEIVRSLVVMSCDVDKVVPDRFREDDIVVYKNATAMSIAVSTNQLQCVEILASKSNLDIKTEFNGGPQVPLEIAIGKGNTDINIISILAKSDPNINGNGDKYSENLYHRLLVRYKLGCCDMNKIKETIKILLDAKYNPGDVGDNFGFYVLDWISERKDWKNYTDILLMFVQANISISQFDPKKIENVSEKYQHYTVCRDNLKDLNNNLEQQINDLKKKIEDVHGILKTNN